MTTPNPLQRLNSRSALSALALMPAFALAAETSTHLASVLQPFVDHGTLAGAVTLLAAKDKLLDLESVGFADIGAKKPMQTDALFWIASQSKPMTATALMAALTRPI